MSVTRPFIFASIWRPGSGSPAGTSRTAPTVVWMSTATPLFTTSSFAAAGTARASPAKPHNTTFHISAAMIVHLCPTIGQLPYHDFHAISGCFSATAAVRCVICRSCAPDTAIRAGNMAVCARRSSLPSFLAWPAWLLRSLWRPQQFLSGGTCGISERLPAGMHRRLQFQRELWQRRHGAAGKQSGNGVFRQTGYVLDSGWAASKGRSNAAVARNTGPLCDTDQPDGGVRRGPWGPPPISANLSCSCHNILRLARIG